ncbi:hypothetical protein, partial [Escherichia coli]|uniref:hypothetical protein n=1 Tax=Escherichia coli TaxID=562 RepID=UPI001BC870CA
CLPMLKHVSFVTRDLAATLAFYVRLGGVVEKIRPRPVRVQGGGVMGPGYALACLPMLKHVSFVTRDLAATLAFYVRLGGVVEKIR